MLGPTFVVVYLICSHRTTPGPRIATPNSHRVPADRGHARARDSRRLAKDSPGGSPRTQTFRSVACQPSPHADPVPSSTDNSNTSERAEQFVPGTRQILGTFVDSLATAPVVTYTRAIAYRQRVRRAVRRATTSRRCTRSRRPSPSASGRPVDPGPAPGSVRRFHERIQGSPAASGTFCRPSATYLQYDIPKGSRSADRRPLSCVTVGCAALADLSADVPERLPGVSA